MPLDPVALAQALIRRPSVTPADAGAMDVAQQALTGLGFACRRLRFGEIENLYARRGLARPNLCFAGHTDVVPPGDLSGWLQDPFEAALKDGVLVGRGAVDMKGSIAAFIAAVSETPDVPGSICLLITGDEEGDATDGTVRVVEMLRAEGEAIDHCVVGEPSSTAFLGDEMKIGRRGSLNARIMVEGVQGHVAYPDRAANPVPVLVDLLSRLAGRTLDEGHPSFPPSKLEITTVDVGNPTSNLIPARAKARLNIRFNPAHTGASLTAWLEAERAKAAAAFSGKVTLSTKISGEAFLTGPDAFVDLVSGAVEATVARTPRRWTAGGTSDARFIRELCPVVELGLVGRTMHAVNEAAPVADILALRDIYRSLIERYFGAS